LTTYDELRKQNPTINIQQITDATFKDYGQVYTQYDVSELNTFMDQVAIPSDTNLYVPSNPAMEAIPVVQEIGRDIFGGLPIEAGECAGHADALTAFEYHQGSELNVFMSPVVMVLGKRGQMHDGQFELSDAAYFYVPAGSVIEFFSDTLHYTPCEVTTDGFKFIVMLINGSNQPLPSDFHSDNPLLVKTNKFQFVHTSRQDKIAQGIHAGLNGELVHVKPVTM